MTGDRGLADYIADHYGSCRLGPACECLKKSWLGTACQNWVPTKARNWEELRAMMVDTSRK